MVHRAEFSLQFLGCGNARSKPPQNYNNNAILRANGKLCLIDCGILCPLAMHEMGLKVTDIDEIFITHLHGDHVLGLEECFLTSYFFHGKRLNMLLPDGLLTRYSGIDGSDIWENCLRAALQSLVFERDGSYRELDFEDFANLRIISPGELKKFAGLDVEIFPVEHVPLRPCYGLFIDGRIAYTSDCIFSREAIEGYLNKGAELIFHDVSFAPVFPGGVHAPFEELKTLPREIAEKIVLMHYDDASSPDDFQAAYDHGFRIAQRGELFSF